VITVLKQIRRSPRNSPCQPFPHAHAFIHKSLKLALISGICLGPPLPLQRRQTSVCAFAPRMTVISDLRSSAQLCADSWSPTMPRRFFNRFALYPQVSRIVPSSGAAPAAIPSSGIRQIRGVDGSNRCDSVVWTDFACLAGMRSGIGSRVLPEEFMDTTRGRKPFSISAVAYGKRTCLGGGGCDSFDGVPQPVDYAQARWTAGRSEYHGDLAFVMMGLSWWV
jgi:hypothetical protein